MKQLDEGHQPGGFFRVANRVVDAEGVDLGDEAVAKADQIDQDHKDEAEKAHKDALKKQAEAASGGAAGVLGHLLGLVDRSASANRAVSTPRAASQEEGAGQGPGVSAATLTGSPGPTPVGVRGVGLHVPEATASAADSMPDIEEVIASKPAPGSPEAEAASNGLPAPATDKSVPKKSGKAPVVKVEG